MIKDLKSTILMDNITFRRDLIAEHGLCLFIETNKGNMLFDTGASPMFIENAKKLGIALDNIDALVLSHGHYDHTGGIRALLEYKSPLKIYMHTCGFEKKVKKDCKGECYPIGMPCSRENLESLGARFIEIKDPQELAEGILLTGSIPRKTDFESLNSTLCIEEEGHIWVDPLWDDQALIINMEDASIVITGCAHSGIVNTLEYIQSLEYAQPIGCIIGGMHLKDADDEQIQDTISYLKKIEFSQLIALHCTGFYTALKLASAFGEKFHVGSVGDIWEFKGVYENESRYNIIR